MGPGWDGPIEILKDNMGAPTKSHGAANGSAELATPSSSKGDDDQSQYQVPPFRLEAIQWSNSTDSHQENFLSPHSEEPLCLTMPALGNRH